MQVPKDAVESKDACSELISNLFNTDGSDGGVPSQGVGSSTLASQPSEKQQLSKKQLRYTLELVAESGRTLPPEADSEVCRIACSKLIDSVVDVVPPSIELIFEKVYLEAQMPAPAADMAYAGNGDRVDEGQIEVQETVEEGTRTSIYRKRRSEERSPKKLEEYRERQEHMKVSGEASGGGVGVVGAQRPFIEETSRGGGSGDRMARDEGTDKGGGRERGG